MSFYVVANVKHSHLVITCLTGQKSNNYDDKNVIYKWRSIVSENPTTTCGN